MAAGKLLFVLGMASALAAQVSVFPLEEVRAGLRATGLTVFSGSEIEEFQVEILGVLENAGPKQSVILGRLSGGPLERTGVLQGMSGSPVYVDGRLLGAVALAFPLSKEPIAGIRPIEEMLREAPASRTLAANHRPSLWESDLTRHFAPRSTIIAGPSRLVEIATPVSFSGFTQGTIEQFAPQLRALGMEPTQGLSGGGAAAMKKMGDGSLIRPGSMISVLLLLGDMSLGADGTVTHVDGENLYAFGHRFLSVGATELPFTRSEVLTLAPNLATSFKISAARELMGTITSDYSTAVRGVLGQRAEMVPLNLTVNGPAASGNRQTRYRIEMVDDRYLAPFLLQMALYSAIDATERTLGASTVSINGRIAFGNGLDPVLVNETYSGSGNIPAQASLATAIPVAYLLQSGFEDLRLEEISLEVNVFSERRQWTVDQVWPARKTVRPGEEIEIVIVLVGEDGEEQVRKVSYAVPEGAPEGTLHVTVADAAITNLLEYRGLFGARMRSPERVVELLNELRDNSAAYVRFWRADRSYQIQGRTLPSPPPSVELVLGRGRSTTGGTAAYSSKVAEIRLDLGEAVVTGSKTVQVEVKK